MKRLIILLLSLILISCTDVNPEPTTAWDKTDYTDVNGIVMIATGWAKAHLCTGNLIREDVVLTAAHCAVFPAEDLYIVYGCNDIDDSSCKRIPVKSRLVHPKYKKEFIASHDIALMFTESPIPLKLAEISARTDLPEGLSVRAVGFGRRNGDSGILYVGRGRIERDYDYELVAHMRGSLDPNPGDSGGPALIMDNGVFKIVGVLSRAQWTSTSKKEVFEHSGYAIYTKPVMYIDWIKESIYNNDCGLPQ